MLLVLTPSVLNAVALWPELALPVPNLNDDATHYLAVQRASDALRGGENPFDHWIAAMELGFPLFLYYQHVPHLSVVLLHRVLFQQIDLFTLFNCVRYLLLVGFPLTVYWSMRRLEFPGVAAAVGAAASTLLVSNKGYGLEYGSYVWGGLGVYTQLWAMHLSFITLGCFNRLLVGGRGYVAAAASASTLALSHVFYSYMLVPAVVVLFLIGLDRRNVRARLLRLGVTGALTLVITSYFWLPFLLLRAYVGLSPYLQRWKVDSYGAGDILLWLADGDLLDDKRLPVLTVLLALGVAAAIQARMRSAMFSLAVFVIWLALYCGRPTWGRLIDVLPLHEGLLLHRFIGGVHLAAILLIGLGGQWIWEQLHPLPERWRMAVAGAVVMALLIPALRERQQYYASNAAWMERTQHALDRDDDARAILAALEQLPPGRTYAGLRATWGKDLAVGDLRFYHMLAFRHLVSLAPPYGGLSLPADLIWHFDDQNLAHYELFNVTYVVAPRGPVMPSFLDIIKETPRYILYRAPTGGWARFVAITGTSRLSSQLALFTEGRRWLLGPEPAQDRFVRYDYPDGRGVADAAPLPAGRSGCPGGRLEDVLVGPSRLDLKVECPQATALMVKIPFHPQWHVSIDGASVPTFMVSPGFLGFDVPAGMHEVRVEYRARAYKTFLLILGGCVALAMGCFRRRIETLA